MTTDIVSDKWRIFEPVIEDNSTTKFEYKKIYSPNHGSIDSVDTVKFEIKDNDSFIFPHKGYLNITGKVTDKNTGVAYAEADYPVALQNGGGIFSEARIFVNDKEIERIDLLHRKMHLTSILDYSDDTIRSLTTDQMVFMDSGDGGLDARPIIIGGATLDTGSAGALKNSLNLKDAIINNPAYTSGFAIRNELTKTGTFHYRMPLARVFGFCSDYRKVLRGAQFRIEFRRNPAKEVVLVTGTDIATDHEPVFTLSECTMMMPYLQPSLEVLSTLEEALANNSSSTIGFNYWNTYGPNLFKTTQLNHTITSLVERPSKVIFALKLESTYLKADENSLTYGDDLQVSSIQLRAGSSSVFYPEQPIEINWANNDYVRLYEEFLRCCDKQGFDGGPTVSYQSFKSLYRFYCFDLRDSMKNVVFGQGQTVDLTVQMKVDNGGAANFYLFTWIQSERDLSLDIVNRQTLISVR
jgi:hypothetical protein